IDVARAGARAEGRMEKSGDARQALGIDMKRSPTNALRRTDGVDGVGDDSVDTPCDELANDLDIVRGVCQHVISGVVRARYDALIELAKIAVERDTVQAR